MTPSFLQSLLLRYRTSGFSAARFSTVFSARKPRHPLGRLVFGLAGIALLAVLLVFGVLIGAAMLAAGLAMRLLGRRGHTHDARARADVIDGDFRVVDKPLLR